MSLIHAFRDRVARITIPIIQLWSRRLIGDAPIFFEVQEGHFIPVYHVGRRVVFEAKEGRFAFFLICYPEPAPKSLLIRAYRLNFQHLERINRKWLCKRRLK